MRYITSITLLSLVSSISFAQSTTVSTTKPWSASQLQNAKQMLPIANHTTALTGSAALTQASVGIAKTVNGTAGSSIAPNNQQLFTPILNNSNNSVIIQDAGTYNAHFTTSIVESGYATLENSYPWRTVGKLYFQDSGGLTYQCSASVIAKRLIATAGHCVHSGNGSASGWYKNFLFIPAFDSGIAPYKTWTVRAVQTTNDWYVGAGRVPNAADYAMLEVNDQAMTTGGAPMSIGDVVGTLGWQTLSLSTNHTTKLGYPCNFASCQKMIQSISGQYRNTSPNNVEYGSDMGGGSSGGPWVQNFNASCGNTGCGSNAGVNKIVAVTSYGYTSSGPRVLGASILDTRWVNLWNAMCALKAGNC